MFPWSEFEFIARLVELEHWASFVCEMNLGTYTGAIGGDAMPLVGVGSISEEHGFKSAREFSPIQLYRSLNADRLKISGCGQWPLAKHLGSILWLPFQEPKILEHHLPVTWVGPSLTFEDEQENFKRLKVWDGRGLLAPFHEAHFIGFALLTFNNFKNKLCDRQIGDRRWFNGVEFHPQGPSALLPSGSNMTTLIGCSSDRRDFYHQAAVSRERAFTNLMPFEHDISEFEGSKAPEAMFAVIDAPRSRDIWNFGLPNISGFATSDFQPLQTLPPPSALDFPVCLHR